MADGRMASVVRAMDAALFGARLPKGIEVVWHDEGPHAGITCGRLISLHEDLLRQSRTKLLAILAHELAHIATANEREEHGIRWRRLVADIGLDPDSGAVRHRGRFAQFRRSLS